MAMPCGQAVGSEKSMPRGASTGEWIASAAAPFQLWEGADALVSWADELTRQRAQLAFLCAAAAAGGAACHATAARDSSALQETLSPASDLLARSHSQRLADVERARVDAKEALLRRQNAHWRGAENRREAEAFRRRLARCSLARERDALEQEKLGLEREAREQTRCELARQERERTRNETHMAELDWESERLHADLEEARQRRRQASRMHVLDAASQTDPAWVSAVGVASVSAASQGYGDDSFASYGDDFDAETEEQTPSSPSHGQTPSSPSQSQTPSSPAQSRLASSRASGISPVPSSSGGVYGVKSLSGVRQRGQRRRMTSEASSISEDMEPSLFSSVRSVAS